MKIDGKKVTVNANRKKVFEFLSDFNNFERLMPEQIVNWKSTSEGCSFTVKGMADLSLKFDEKTPYSQIVLIPEGKSPFKFSLIARLEEDALNEQKTKVGVDVDADLNPMLAMMAKKPLANLVDVMGENLNKVFG